MNYRFLYFIFIGLLLYHFSAGQLSWQMADADFGTLPTGFHVYKTSDSLDGRPFLAYYAIADLKNKKLFFSTDTTLQRRLSPGEFYQKNNYPLLVVNGSFFSFNTNQNLNLVIKKGKLLSYNIHNLAAKGKDTLTYRHPWNGAFGINKNRMADVAWVFTDSSNRWAYASQEPVKPIHDSIATIHLNQYKGLPVKKWKMKTAIAGGPVLLQNGQINISNDTELKFSGIAKYDLHPRTVIGYTKDHKIIVLVVEGRHKNIADGASLIQCAEIMKSLGCVEALNLDGGGSSCMLINGKETIWPSDKGIQRKVPAVFLIETR